MQQVIQTKILVVFFLAPFTGVLAVNTWLASAAARRELRRNDILQRLTTFF